MVSAVVKVFETITTTKKKKKLQQCRKQKWNPSHLSQISSKKEKPKPYLPRVVSGFNPVIFLATSIGSTFARLHIEAYIDFMISLT